MGRERRSGGHTTGRAGGGGGPPDEPSPGGTTGAGAPDPEPAAGDADDGGLAPGEQLQVCSANSLAESLAADCDLETGFPLQHLRRSGRWLTFAGFIVVALSLPAECVSWSLLILASAVLLVTHVLAPAAIGNGPSKTLVFSGGLLLSLGLVKRIIDFPSPFSTGPTGLLLWSGASVYLWGAAMLGGFQWGSAARRSREAQLLRLMASFQAELLKMKAGARGARAPVILQCGRCGVVFAWFARKLLVHQFEPGQPPTRRRVELMFRGAIGNFEFRITESVSCPRCSTVDDYTYVEDPAFTLREALENVVANPESRPPDDPLAWANVTEAGSGGTLHDQWIKLEEEVGRHPGCIQARVRLARLYHWLRLGRLARMECMAALRTEPTHMPARILFAELLRNRGNAAEAQMLLMGAAAELLAKDPEADLDDDPELKAVLEELSREEKPGRKRRKPSRSRSAKC